MRVTAAHDRYTKVRMIHIEGAKITIRKTSSYDRVRVWYPVEIIWECADQVGLEFAQAFSKALETAIWHAKALEEDYPAQSVVHVESEPNHVAI